MSGPEYEDFGVEIDFRGWVFTPDCATLHLFTNPKYNLLAIALSESHHEYELVNTFEQNVLARAGVGLVAHDQPDIATIEWYENKVMDMAAELVVESSEFLDYNG